MLANCSSACRFRTEGPFSADWCGYHTNVLNTPACFLKIHVSGGVLALLVLLLGKHQLYLPEAAPCSQLGLLQSDPWTPEFKNTHQTVRGLCVCVISLPALTRHLLVQSAVKTQQHSAIKHVGSAIVHKLLIKHQLN